jgi:Rieske Fe-S protein
MFRRTFLAAGLTLAGAGRRVWAQLADGAPRYFPLRQPITVPLDAVKAPWEPVTFTAEAMAPATATTASRRVLIAGVLFRKGAALPSGELSALCLTCPHEQCKVDLISDPSRLTAITGGTTSHPLFECGCHGSVFDAAKEGERISGETPRGLYRFRITRVTEGVVEFGEIEEAALYEV